MKKEIIEKLENMSIEELKNYIEINLDTIRESNLNADTKSHLKKVVEKAREILREKEVK